MSNDLTHKLAVIASDALSSIGDEVRNSIDNLKIAGKDIFEKGQDVSKNLADLMQLVIKKEVDPDQAEDLISRELDALALLASAAKEVAAREAITRCKNALDIAAKAGLALLKLGVGFIA